jgi:hypothetical protein
MKKFSKEHKGLYIYELKCGKLYRWYPAHTMTLLNINSTPSDVVMYVGENQMLMKAGNIFTYNSAMSGGSLDHWYPAEIFIYDHD